MAPPGARAPLRPALLDAARFGALMFLDGGARHISLSLFQRTRIIGLESQPSSCTHSLVVTVKLKYADFTLKTRALRLRELVFDTDSIYAAARELLTRFELGRGIRLTGVSMSGLVSIDETRLLFPDERVEKNKKLQAVAAALKDRFGDGQITRAALPDKPRR